jgi:hypothetical protein
MEHREPQRRQRRQRRQRPQPHATRGALVLGLGEALLVLSLFGGLMYYSFPPESSGVIAGRQVTTALVAYTAVAVLAATVVSVVSVVSRGMRSRGAALGRSRRG